ncbi:MAG TPA: glycosyltransferase [Solirubrobacterales bacterium]|nr:glycosyltransferase [Solirubrobacterales bacterium]
MQTAAPEGSRVAYVVGRYPAVSHAFVTREVLALRAAGVEVETISIHRAEDGDALSATDRAERERTYALLPVRLGPLLGAHLRAFAGAPRAYLATLFGALRDGPPGIRGRVWQLFYFLEAIMVWNRCRSRGVRHLHAHHLNQAADAAMLAVRYANARGGSAWTWSFTMHGPNELYDVSRFQLAEKASEAAAVACISDFARSQVMGFTDEERWSRLTVVHCGVDPTEFDPGETPSANGGAPEKDAALEGAAPFRVLYVGRLVPFKGQAILLEAIAALRARGIDARLTMIGEGPAREGAERRAAEFGLNGEVRFAGAVGQDEIRSHYAAADVFCLPSFAEGVPVVLMEAMAMAVPVVTSRIMGITELVDDGEQGLLVRPGRADELAAALERLARDPALRERLGRGGRAKVSAEFDVRESGRRLAAIFAAQEGARRA